MSFNGSGNQIFDLPKLDNGIVHLELTSLEHRANYTLGIVEKDEHQTARLAETEQTLMRSVEELHDSADRDRMESARVAQTQENKFDSLIEQHSERIARQHEHFTSVASSMAPAIR